MARPTRDRCYAPRGLRLPDAARWLGIGQTKFLQLVGEQRVPSPQRIDGVVVWDRYKLDLAFDDLAMPDTTPQPSDDTWEAQDA